MVWDLSKISASHGIYNLGSGIPVSLKFVVELLLEIADIDCLINQFDEPRIRKVDKEFVVADISKISGNKVSLPDNTLRDTLEEMYRTRKMDQARLDLMEKND
jgi:nucleoside-diphosphate-sugar epimerase